MNQLLTLTKALDILNLLAESQEGLSPQDISTKLNIPPSTTYRLINTLDNYEFTHRASRGIVTLGTGVLALARKINLDYENQLYEIALPIMSNLTEITNETSVLHIRAGFYTTCIVSVPSKSMIKFVAEKRRFIPLTVGCSGLSILAFESDEIIDSVTSKLNASAKATLLDKIHSTQENGYYISSQEYDEDTLGLGVPIFNKDKKIYASLSIVGPEFRMNRLGIPHTISCLKDASASITAALS